MRISFCVVLGALTFTAACVDGTAPTSRVLPDVASASITSPDPSTIIPGEYVVVLRPGTRDVAVEAHFATAVGGRVTAVWVNALRGFAATLSPPQLAVIARRGAVAFIESNAIVRAQASQPCAPYTSCSWGLDRIDETNLPMDGRFVTPAKNGSGSHAYVIDTGIRITHNDFGGRASYGIDIVDGDAIADDCNGHGTSMASLIGGQSLGVAKGVNLVAVRVLDCSGAGSTANVISGIDWVTLNAVHPAVANMSLGGGISVAMDAAVNASIQSGITYVASAGGSMSSACNFSPARVPAVITVGGTGNGAGVPPTSPDDRTPSSNTGPCLDLFAPGANILSASNASNAATFVTTGTSNATAFTTGAAALFLDFFPNKTPAQVSAAIVGNASAGVVGNPGAGSPNRLLNIGKPHRP